MHRQKTRQIDELRNLDQINQVVFQPPAEDSQDSISFDGEDRMRENEEAQRSPKRKQDNKM